MPMLARTILLILLACVALVGCQKQSEKPSTPPPAVEPAVATPEPSTAEPEEKLPEHKPLLWQIDGPKGPVYLLGTIHVGFDADERLPEYVWERMNSSEVFVMETDLSQAQASMGARAALPEGQTLEAMLGEKHWGELDQRLGGVADQFNSVKPWFIVSMLTMKMLPDGPRPAPMDQVLHQRAVEQGKKLSYLETPDFQLSVLEETLTLDELKEMLDEFDEQKGDLAKMLDYYQAGDVDSIISVSFKDKDEKPEMYEKLFYQRNENWIPKIKNMVDHGNVFVAFGAGHMFGERGVLDLLEKEGIKAYRVTAENAGKAKENNENAAPPKPEGDARKEGAPEE